MVFELREYPGLMTIPRRPKKWESGMYVQVHAVPQRPVSDVTMKLFLGLLFAGTGRQPLFSDVTLEIQFSLQATILMQGLTPIAGIFR